MNTFHIHKAAGILIKDKKLLVEKSDNKDFFVAPGGSIEDGETPIEALIRELKEEFDINVLVDDLEEFGIFTANAAGQENKVVKMETFIVKKWDKEPTPHAEVREILWVTSDLPKDIEVGSIFQHEVIPRLKSENLID
jgi:8-oxo-dGTP diphosphatase